MTVDYFSNLFEIDYLSTTTSNTVVKKLKGHMARYGIPDEVVVLEAEVQKYMFTYHSEGQFHFMFILYL